MKKKLDNEEISEIIDLLFEELSNHPLFETFFDLDEDIQEHYKSKLCEILAEWRDEDDNWD